MTLKRLELMAGLIVLAAVTAYLSMPGHPLATLFYNHSPLLFRQTVHWEQSTNAIQQVNGEVLWTEIKNHLSVTVIAAAFATLICFPLGVAASRVRAVKAIATNLTGIARAIPGVAVLFLLYPYLGQGEQAGALALMIVAAPPIFLNTVAGYAGVDRTVTEAARGMGMNQAQIFLRIESPLAASVVIAGIRIAIVEIIASATILPFSANFDTLGSPIIYYVNYPNDVTGQNSGVVNLAVGFTLVATIALAAELMLTVFQRAVAPAHR